MANGDGGADDDWICCSSSNLSMAHDIWFMQQFERYRILVSHGVWRELRGSRTAYSYMLLFRVPNQTALS